MTMTITLDLLAVRVGLDSRRWCLLEYTTIYYNIICVLYVYIYIYIYIER